MGVGVSLDAEKDAAKKILEEFTLHFAKNYAKCYTLGIMKMSKRKMIKEAAGPVWQLYKNIGQAPPPIRKEGPMKKLSKHLKKWNPRYFVVRGDWIIDYYPTKEDFEKHPQKPLGSVNMSGLTVIRDVNDTLVKRIMTLAEKCKLPVEQLPKPEQYPDFTIEIYHSRRAPIHLQCENAEEFKEWCDMLDRCRWFAPELNINDDKIHQQIFNNALWRTRWEVGMWGWWYSGGGEVNAISDCINDQIEEVVMCKVDEKLTMPWAARSRIRDGFMKATSNLVTAAVNPMWKTAYEGVKKARPTLEEKIKEGMKPIVDAQITVQDKIKELVISSTKDTLNQQFTPHLQPLIEILFSPVIDSLKLIVQAFDKAVDDSKANYKEIPSRQYTARNHYYNNHLWDAERVVWQLYDPLWALRLVFEDISPWAIQGRACRQLRRLLNNALFTFEVLLEGGCEERKISCEKRDWDAAKAAARQMLEADCKTAVLRIIGKIMKGVVGGMWDKVVVRPARTIVKPIADTIPDALKDFIDIEDMLVETLDVILTTALATLFEPFTSRIVF